MVAEAGAISRVSVTKPTTARRPPTCALTLTALLDFDDEVDKGALPVILSSKRN